MLKLITTLFEPLILVDVVSGVATTIGGTCTVTIAVDVLVVPIKLMMSLLPVQVY
jgi:hypothetical protein